MTYLECLLLLLLLGGCGGWFCLFRRNWRRLVGILEKLAAGQAPGPIRFPHAGRFEHLVHSLEKIAEVQARDRARRHDDEFNLNAIVSSMVEGLLIVDARRVIRLANDALLRLFALERSPVGRTLLEALRAAAIDEIVRAALASSEPQSREISLSLPGGQPRHFTANAVAMRDANGNVSGAIVILHDVSRLRHLEQMQRDFVANVSHELRTPLSIFQGYLETLIDHPDTPPAEIREYLLVMQKHSRRLNAIVEDLLTLARLETREAALNLHPLEPAAFLQQIARDWQVRAAHKKIAITVETTPDLPAILADGFRLEQVFNNLLDNAIKYTPEAGRIVLRAIPEDGGFLRFEVSDTGIGIPPASLPHIFERFYRVDKNRSRDLGGTGLGLSIVKQLVTLHGGQVGAESTPGAGTTVFVRLPPRPGTDPAASQPGAPGTGPAVTGAGAA